MDDLGDLMELCAGQADPANCGRWRRACRRTRATPSCRRASRRYSKRSGATTRSPIYYATSAGWSVRSSVRKASALDHVLHVVALRTASLGFEKSARGWGRSNISRSSTRSAWTTWAAPIVGVISIFGKLCTEEGAVAIQMEANVPYTLKWALQTHAAAKRLCEKCVLNASRLVAGNDDARTGYVCEQVTPELVASLETHNGDADFVVAVLKCFGAFSLHDPSIFTMVSHGVTEKVVSATERHGDHAQLLRTAVELFGNLGAAEDDDLDARCTALLLEGGPSTPSARF